MLKSFSSTRHSVVWGFLRTGFFSFFKGKGTGRSLFENLFRFSFWAVPSFLGSITGQLLLVLLWLFLSVVPSSCLRRGRCFSWCLFVYRIKCIFKSNSDKFGNLCFTSSNWSKQKHLLCRRWRCSWSQYSNQMVEEFLLGAQKPWLSG